MPKRGAQLRPHRMVDGVLQLWCRGCRTYHAETAFRLIPATGKRCSRCQPSERASNRNRARDLAREGVARKRRKSEYRRPAVTAKLPPMITPNGRDLHGRRITR